MEDYKLRELRAKASIMRWSVIGAILLLLVIMGGLWGCPTYRVWQQSKEGEAELKRAEQNRQIAVQEARAKLESAELIAQADTLRAHGVARSNQIIGLSITPEYLKWFWIENLDKSDNVIYVPTEVNIPIMEAGRVGVKTSSP